MKKKIIVSVILIICILGFVSTIYFLYLPEKVPSYFSKELTGEKINDGVYKYTLDVKDYNHSDIVHDNNIYYWIELDDRYEFYKVNIYKNKKEKIGEFKNKNYYCYFEKDYIDCSGDTSRVLYNYDFKEIYRGNDKVSIPYKNDFIKIEDNIIYYKDKEYKKMTVDYANYSVYDHSTFDNNIFLYFSDIAGDGCIYNVEDNKCENYEYSSISDYSSGIYFINGNSKINVIDINSKEQKEYDNPIKNEYLTTTFLDKNNLYNFVDDYLRIYDLENNKAKLFDYRINSVINNIYLKDNLLFLTSSEEVFVIELDKITTKEMNSSDIEIELDKKLNERINKIKEDYDVEIKIRKDADLKFSIFKEKITGERDYDLINDSLDSIEEVFSSFGKEFFKEFIHDEYKGLRIYIVNRIEATISMAGEAFRYYNNYAIIADTSEFKRTLYHELMHSMEDAVDAKNKTMFKKWSDYNPKGFKYRGKYDEYASPYEYTVSYGKGDIYFVDNYAQTTELEDRARIFENICMNTDTDIKNNPYLLRKAEYVKNEIIKFYPMLESSKIFDNLK